MVLAACSSFSRSPDDCTQREGGSNQGTGLGGNSKNTLVLACVTCLYFPTLLHTPATAKSLQSCPSLRPHRQQLTRLPHPWDSPGKNTGVGCHFLLQCMKVKNESEVTQSCLTLSNPIDCSLPGSSVHGIFQARVLEWGAITFSVHHP